MSNRLFVYLFLSVTIFLSSFIIFFNSLIDPLWFFSHENSLNKVQKDFNERLQKTNYLFYNKNKKYDGVLIGSSRATYINQNEFDGMKIFNYAASNMYPIEFKPYIDFVKKLNGNHLEYIIIGLDFFAYAEYEKLKFEAPSVYINNLSDPFYMIKSLLSYDTFKYSKDDIKASYETPSDYYDRQNIKYHKVLTEESRKRNLEKSLKEHLKMFNDNNFKINKKYKDIFESIKRDNKDTKIIVYTSPISSKLLSSILKNKNRLNDFKNWLREIVDIFGEVNHFMTFNTITNNLSNYPDDDHLYPKYINLIANKITKKNLDKIPPDFGVVLNKKNLEEFILTLEND